MNLLTETLLVALLMFGLCMVPLYSERVRRYSKFMYLLGTGALAGILVFDLIPDLFEMGGKGTLWGVGFVWLLYSALHILHLRHHKDVEPQDHAHGHGSSFFLVSMIGHCIASGMLLVIAERFSGKLSHTIFLALLAHKAYESLTVSSVLLKNQFTRNQFVAATLAYSLSMPAGAAITYVFRDFVTPNVVLLITSVAAGTLAGCLIFDFLIPSLIQVKSRKHAATWILIGLSLTQVLMKSL